MFRYVKDKWYYIVLIIALLFLQASCDLALPDYTSKIVNVGIQQKGIEDGVPDEIRKSSMERLFLFMDSEERAYVEESYTLESGIYVRNKTDAERRERLNQIFGVPMLAVSGLSGESEEAADARTQMGLPEDADMFEVLGKMPEEQRQQMLAEQADKFEEMPESIVTQSAVGYLQNEYAQMGRDLDKMQTDYLVMSGLKMLGMALLIMLAAVTVTFLSSRVASYMGRNLRNQVYRKVISFSGAELNKFSTASLITRSTNDIQQIQMLATMIFRIVLYAPILGVGGVIKVFQTDMSMTWILALAVGLILLVVAVLFGVAMPKFTLLQNLIDKLNLVTRETLTGIMVIRAFSTEKHEEERFEEANRRLTKTNLFVNRVMTFMMPLMMLIMNGISVLIV